MSGLVFITGFSDSGKTTLASSVATLLAQSGIKAVLLDGDILRSCLKNSDYSSEARAKIAMTYARLANMLTKQGFLVILASISMFSEAREFNRKNNANYLEVFLDISLSLRKKRDTKGLFAKNEREMATEVDLPQNSDLVFKDGFSLDEASQIIAAKIMEWSDE